MNNLWDILQAIVFTILILSLWFIIPIIGILLGTAIIMFTLYFLFKEYREHKNDSK